MNGYRARLGMALAALPLLGACTIFDVLSVVGDDVTRVIAPVDPDAYLFEVPESALAGADFRVFVVSIGGADVVGTATDVKIADRTVTITPYHDVKSRDEVISVGLFFSHVADLRFDEPGPVEIRIRQRHSDLVYTVQVTEG